MAPAADIIGRQPKAAVGADPGMGHGSGPPARRGPRLRVLRYPGRLRPVIMARTRFSRWRRRSTNTPHRCPTSNIRIRAAKASCRFSSVLEPQKRSVVCSQPVSAVAAIVTISATALNGYLQRIQTQIEAERQSATHAAHELRTPLAVASAQAQLIATGAGDAGAARKMSAALDRLGRIAERLSQLSRAKLQFDGPAGCDLVRIIRIVLAEQPEASVIFVDADLEAAPVAVHPDAIALLVGNALRNAIEHGTGGVPLWLGGLVGANDEGEGDGTGLATSEGGVGLSRAQLQDIQGFIRRAEGWDFTTVWAPGGNGHLPGLYSIDPVLWAVPDNLRATYGDAALPAARGNVRGLGLYVFRNPDDLPDVTGIFSLPPGHGTRAAMPSARRPRSPRRAGCAMPSSPRRRR